MEREANLLLFVIFILLICLPKVFNIFTVKHRLTNILQKYSGAVCFLTVYSMELLIAVVKEKVLQSDSCQTEVI